MPAIRGSCLCGGVSYLGTRVTLATQPWQLMPFTFSSRLSMFTPSIVQATGRKRRNVSALPTTDTELIAIAAPAITGLRNPSAASGIPSTL